MTFEDGIDQDQTAQNVLSESISSSKKYSVSLNLIFSRCQSLYDSILRFKRIFDIVYSL